MVLWRGENLVVKRYAFWARKPELHAKDRLGLPYCFLDEGFFKMEYLWSPFPIVATGHIFWFYMTYLTIVAPNLPLLACSLFTCMCAAMGITCGSHRLWTHHSYKANFPLRVFLMMCHSMMYNLSIYDWSEGHRTHHKYSDSDGDPHNAMRGLAFSHVGWLFKKEHPLVNIKAKGIDLSDLLVDPIVRFQHENYTFCYLFFGMFLPTASAVYLCSETWWNAFLYMYLARATFSVHVGFFVNSWAHLFGDKPYNDKVQPGEHPIVSFGLAGEGYHNYHHAFPWDYGIGEVGNYFNMGKMFIDLMASLGFAYGLRQASPEMIVHAKEKARARQAKEVLGYD